MSGRLIRKKRAAGGKGTNKLLKGGQSDFVIEFGDTLHRTAPPLSIVLCLNSVVGLAQCAILFIFSLIISYYL